MKQRVKRRNSLLLDLVVSITQQLMGDKILQGSAAVILLAGASRVLIFPRAEL